MTAWLITAADGATATIEAAEPTTRTDGSLWLLREVAPKPAPLVPVVIFARGQWISVVAADAEVASSTPPPPPPPPPPQPPAEPRLLPATSPPERRGW